MTAGAVSPQPARAPAATVVLLAALLLAVVTALVILASGREAPASVLGPEPVTVHLAIEHSRFLTDRIHVRPGTVVTFVVDNHDPINHELIVGPEPVHARHRNGSEAAHPPVPGEVSVGPGETASTVYRFDEAGPVRFACHLPRHLEYGMEGVVIVG